MTDLFDKRTAKDKLLAWLRGRNWAKTSDVLKWGTENHSNRALRNAQQLCADGLITRIGEADKIRIFGPIKEDVWTTHHELKGESR